MSVEKTVEFLLVQVSKVVDVDKACLGVGDMLIAYDRKENRFHRPLPEEIHSDGWKPISLENGNLYLQVSLNDPDVEALRKHCSQAINNAREYDKVLKETLVDPLTGLLNKRALCERLMEEIVRCSRSRGVFCVAFFDVNNLKEINDIYGHLAGDSVLKGVAATIRRFLRKSDVVGRFGGDEFVALLAGASLHQGKTAVERLLEKVVQEVTVGGISVSISAGIACYPEDGHDVERLIETADKRMYENKLSRRGVKA
jgi:diguanylate cyclase (GGDEF)-like protein